MKPPHDEHITQEQYEAVCRNRDRWMQMAVEQQQYIQQLEKQVMSLQKQLGIKVQDKELFCRITQEAYDRGQALHVEEDLRSACVSAPKLVKAIRTNEALGYLDTQNLNSKDLYDLLDNHYGLDFGIRNFNAYRSK